MNPHQIHRVHARVREAIEHPSARLLVIVIAIGVLAVALGTALIRSS